MPRLVETDDRFDLPFARERVWPILSRTDWINRSLGLPPVEYDIAPAPGGGSIVRARAKSLGLELRWLEQPFQWLENHFYHVDRVFEGGPIERAHLRWEFSAPTADATSIRVFAQLHPRNGLGQLLCKHVLAKKATRDVAGVIRHVESYLRGEKQIALPKLARQPISEAAFGAALAKLRKMNHSAALEERLTTLIREAPDVQAARIRPLSMARAWQADEWEVLRLFLHATRAGMLSFSWEVLCPNCRSSRQPLTESLANVRREMHCESCQIQYNAEFDKSVELRFAVHPAIRKCDSSTFCLAGPGAKPHVVAQINLQPGERRAWPWPDEAALYRLRSPQVRQSKMIEPGEFAQWMDAGGIAVSGESISIQESLSQGRSSESPALAVSNPFAHSMQLVLEHVESIEPVLTASQITNWQEFRDLFAREVISPTEQIVVGEQIVLFTDLRGSTAMYCGIGDAPAYALVREHFGILQEAIAANHGSIVKTIGDAVMAVFTRIPEALAAVQQMHEGLAARGESLPLQLKSALHLGSCLAVNANDRLDYFGTTINLAARLVDRSTGGDLAVSDEFFGRPDTQNFLRARGVGAEASSVQFRGFTEAVKVWKIPIVINTQAREKI
jgi:class 3 adenylate cyclase